jgi:hypothetical protein
MMRRRSKFLWPLLAIILGTHISSAASEQQTYAVRDGDGGKEAYLKVDDGFQFVIAGCNIDGAMYSFTFSPIASENEVETPLLASLRALKDGTSLQVCVDRVCKNAEFSYSGYFNSPTAVINMPMARTNSSRSLSVVLPDGASLTWNGNLKTLFASACMQPHE